MTFANQNFIVTGAASGIGLATARLLHQRGARLALWDRNAEALEQAARELDAQAMCVDITQSSEVETAVNQSRDTLGALHGVVHSAGVLRAATFHDAPLEAHRRTIEVNLIGTINVAYATLPLLKESRGSLVLLASTAAFYGPPEYTSYGASKAGVLNFAQALRVELAGTGVYVGVVCPLFVSSPMLTGYNGNTRLFRSRSPLLDVRPPEAVASAILDGIARRRFMIWPGWKPRLIFWLSRYASAVGHPLSVLTYRQGGG